MPPILWSFRRCPYAIRARLALAESAQQVALREVVLRDKPAEFLAASPSATVPCLVTQDGVIDESLDIMRWALGRNDPQGWLDMPASGWDWIARIDGPFKHALDRCKYASRYPQEDRTRNLAVASAHLAELDAQIDTWLFGRASVADYAILPFVRQFAFIDKRWFDAQPWPAVQGWLGRFLESARFGAVMEKYPQWVAGDTGFRFPPENSQLLG
ncbi:glutathione S-transferase [Roseinatronobacter thiooxidans]|uniref:Glutathione S-transferase n=1 Tax=Roseinatronobacter thiooxidans TaxID=121821 RepID=A0A2W7QAR3_9RHOB|nr:glutathione S-transferase [Roseinatronobacter thiooxidans]PZX45778.1 glutathione S-transferase [Roseinatronobacter thiooxidans]